MTIPSSLAAAPVSPLPHDLSPWGMFASADPVVQGVMAGLVAASVATWTVGLAKSIQIHRARKDAAVLRQALSGAGGLPRMPEAELVAAARDEMRGSAGLPAAGIKERVAARLARCEAEAVRRMAAGTGLLATVASTAPFVGLLGTVWGIMNAFIGISKAQTTNLAVVAPGIAEALLATALGLVAAIPAVMIYNGLTRAIAGWRSGLAGVSVEILCLAGRELDARRDVAAGQGAAERGEAA
jgi:biopolymer transport protein ExbB